MTITVWITIISSGSSLRSVVHPDHEDAVNYAVERQHRPQAKDMVAARLRAGQHTSVAWDYPAESSTIKCVTEAKRIDLDIKPIRRTGA